MVPHAPHHSGLAALLTRATAHGSRAAAAAVSRTGRGAKGARPTRGGGARGRHPRDRLAALEPARVLWLLRELVLEGAAVEPADRGRQAVGRRRRRGREEEVRLARKEGDGGGGAREGGRAAVRE
eukprot:5041145-Prymnesium_polylepis.1